MAEERKNSVRMDRAELHVKIGEDFHRVDIDQNTNFAFNLQATDLTNPATTKIHYSVQISLPKTKKNNGIFDQIWRIDSQVLNFNPLLRSDFRLFIHNNLYQTGYLKLEDITDSQYKIRLYGGLGDYFYLLTEKKLKDLDFGDTFDHDVQKTFVRQCWEGRGKVKNGVEVLSYAMTYQGEYENFDSDVLVQDGADVAPVDITWYNKKKEYQSPELNEHKRSYLYGEGENPFYGEYRSYYQRPMIRFSTMFEGIVRMMEEEGWKTETDETFFNAYNPYWNDLWLLCPQYDTTEDMTAEEIKWYPFEETVYGSTLEDRKLELRTAFGENNTMERGKVYRITVSLPFKIYARYKDGTRNYHMVKGNSLSIEARVTVKMGEGLSETKILTFKEGGSEIISLYNDTVHGTRPKDHPDNSFYYERVGDEDSKGGSVYTFTGSFTFNTKEASEDDVASLEVDLILNGDTNWRKYKHGSTVRDYGVWIDVQDDASLLISNDNGAGLRSGAEVGYTDIVRSDETCYDFVMSYAKIFGLFFLKDTNSRTVKILTRNSFFAEREILDWTYKMDRGKEYVLRPVPFDYKSGIFQWKSLKTKYEEDYLARTSKEYGSARFDTNYGFSDVEKNMMEGIIFSNCVVATGYSQYYLDRASVLYKDNKTLPYLEDTSDSKVDANFILIFKNKEPYEADNYFLVTDDNDNMLTYGYGWTTSDVTVCRKYPRLERTTVINGESYSLNFGRPSIAYNDEEAMNIANDSREGGETLYARFWKGYLNDRYDQNNKMMTAYFNLTLSDVYQNLFNKFIYINDTVWVISRITGFDPLGKKSTKVELISVKDTSNYVSQNYIAGNFLIRVNGEIKFDSTGQLARSTSPVGIRTTSDAQRVVLEIEHSTSWVIRNVPSGVTVSREEYKGASGTIPTVVTVDLEEMSEEEKTVPYNLIFHWGSTATILQILIVRYWAVRLSTNAGYVYYGNERVEEIRVDHGADVTVRTADAPADYEFAYWTVDGKDVYFTQEIQITDIQDHVTAAARWYDKNTTVKVVCEDMDTVLEETEKPGGRFWLLDIGRNYTPVTANSAVCGYLVSGIERYYYPGQSFTAGQGTTLLTVYYDTMLVNMIVVNDSKKTFDMSGIRIVGPEGIMPGIGGSLPAGQERGFLYEWAEAPSGDYVFSAEDDQEDRYVTVLPEKVRYEPGTAISDVAIRVESIGWEEKVRTVSAETETVTNVLYVPQGMEYRIETPEGIGMATNGPAVDGSYQIAFAIGENTAQTERSITVIASIYKVEADVLRRAEFTISQSKAEGNEGI